MPKGQASGSALAYRGSQAQIIGPAIGFTAFAAAALAFTLPIRAVIPLASSLVSVGLLLAVFTLPVMISSVVRYRYTGVIFVAYVGAFLSGLILLSFSDREVDTRLALVQMSALALSAVSLCAFLWARTQLGVRAIAVFASAGMLVQNVLTANAFIGFSLNLWKYLFAFPVTILLLAAVSKSKARWPTPLVLLVVGFVSAFNGYRSFFAITIVATALYVWTTKRSKSIISSRPRAGFAIVGSVLLLAVSGIFVYQAGVWLSINGYLGERNAMITTRQLEKGSSVISIGRSENAVAWKLFEERPLGYGPGVVAEAGEIAIGKEALTSRGINPESSVMDEYIFRSEGIKLHSVISDLWVQFGLLGLALAVVWLFVAASALFGALTTGLGSGLTLFLAIKCTWDLLFSPLLSSLSGLMFTLALLLPLRALASAADPTRGRQSGAVPEG